jgi:RNA polymerase sigma factor (sigma-70 family)
MSELELLNLVQSSLRKAAQGEQVTSAEFSAWREFHRAHNPVIRAVVKRSATPAVDVDDLAQEVWLRLAHDLPSFKLDPARGTLGGFVVTVARRCTHKIAHRRLWLRAAALSDELAASLLDRQGSPSPEFEEEEYRGRLRQARETVRSGLPELSRTVLDMHLEQEKSVLEIAFALKMSEGAVRMRLFRALRRIRHHVRRQGLVPS